MMSQYDCLRETDENVVILPGAKVMGDVTFGPGCTVWYNAVIRGDAGPIVLGRNCNVQDNCTFHNREKPMVLGDGVTVGHGAILHGCTIGDNTLIGMGAIVLDDAAVGKDCIVAAGAVVSPRTVIPDGSMVMGQPGRVKRPLTPEEIEGNRLAALHYAKRGEQMRE